MAQFYFKGAHLEFLEVRGLIFSKIGINMYQGWAKNNIAKHRKAQMYLKYFLISFLGQKSQEFQSSLRIQWQFTFSGEQLLIIAEDWIV